MLSKLCLILPPILAVLALSSVSFAQDVSPIRKYHVWLPMTGVTGEQMEDARNAGYDTIMLKIHPSLKPGTLREIDFTSTDELVNEAVDKGFNLLLPILGWAGLGDGHFWDTDERGKMIPNRLDPFWPEAMEQVEWYYTQTIEHYRTNPKVVAFVPTWGIYGEAGFTSFSAGRSKYALARFNEWLTKQGLPALDRLPTRSSGPNTDFNRFVHFRYLYLENQFDAMVERLKQHAGKIPVGMWQEMYPVLGYLWTMVEVPSADFALYESCFPFQTNHHPEKSLGETMGFRYRCKSADEYRDYYLPNLARKRGEGQRFMGCQLSNSYVKNYGWTEKQAEEMGFDKWEDEFGPYLKKLLDEPLESPKRDVLLVFPTYAAAALTDNLYHQCDAMLIDVLLRMYGCQMVRYGSPRLDKMSVKDMDRFKLIIVPDAAFIMSETYAKLKKTKAKVLLTGCPARSLDGELTPFGGTRKLDNLKLHYAVRPAGSVEVSGESPLTKGLQDIIRNQPTNLPEDEAFRYDSQPDNVKTLLNCGHDPLLSTWNDHAILIHGHVFAGGCYNPKRVPPDLGGSKDSSANEADMWGPYDSASPQNVFGRVLMKNILDYAKVDYRVPNPKPRTVCHYLGDHLEQASISANIVYNNTGEPQTLTLRTPFKPKAYISKEVNGRWETEVTVPPFSYRVLGA